MAKRMVLVSEQELQRLRNTAAAAPEDRRQAILTSPALQAVLDLDKRLQAILQRSDIDDASRVALYDQMLADYQRASQRAPELQVIRQPQPQPSPPVSAPSQSDLNGIRPSAADLYSDDAVLRLANSKSAAPMSRLLEFLRIHGKDQLAWNRSNGELIIYGRRIPGTQITSLLANLYKSKLPQSVPIGFNDFVSALSALPGLNIENTISSPSVRQMIEEAREQRDQFGKGVKRIKWEKLH